MTRDTPMAQRLKVLVNRIPSLPPRLRALAMRDGLREALERQAEVRAGGTEAAADAWRLAALAADAGGAEQTARAGELLAGRERLTPPTLFTAQTLVS